jgi:hypothetical protein
MKVFSKKTAICLASAIVLGALAATPSVAGVITPADKETVSAEIPLELVWWRYGCHYHRHWACPSHGCVVASDYPRYGWCHRRHYCDSTVYIVAPGWGWGGWGGWGWGGGGLFGFL